jgi:hypothetical protein
VVLGDTLDEPDERYRIALSNVQNATVAEGGGVVTIVDDDGGVLRVGELAHGAAQRGDLVGARDLYVLHQPGYSSWEVIVDEASGDVGTGEGPLLERIAPDLTTVLQHSTPAGVGRSRTLQWVNLASGADRDDYIGVASQGCTDCGPDDVYRVRAYETTLRSARFNCRGGQRSVVVLQNRHRSQVEMWPQFWSESGQRITGAVGYAESLGATVFDICAINALLEDQSGSVTVLHDGAYGQLAGKVVQIDPATGAAFDTPLTVRPR